MKIIVKDIFNETQSEVLVQSGEDFFDDKIRDLACQLKMTQAEAVLEAVRIFIKIREGLK